MMKTMPIFLRLLLAFLAVGALIGGPLIYFSFQFNKDSARLRTQQNIEQQIACLLYTSPSPRDGLLSRMPSSA